jgi:hypothetical protein
MTTRTLNHSFIPVPRDQQEFRIWPQQSQRMLGNTSVPGLTLLTSFSLDSDFSPLAGCHPPVACFSCRALELGRGSQSVPYQSVLSLSRTGRLVHAQGQGDTSTAVHAHGEHSRTPQGPGDMGQRQQEGWLPQNPEEP